MAEPTYAPEHGRHRRRVLLLKYFDGRVGLIPAPARWKLPLALDAITGAGVDLEWTDAAYHPPWTLAPMRWLIRRLERLTTPFLQTLLATRRIARADAVVAVFESQGNFLAALRAARIWPFTRPRFAVVATWLAMDVEHFGSLRRRLYRWAYRGVDHLFYFSRTQTIVYRDLLGVAPDRLAYLPFGVDAEHFVPLGQDDDGYVLAVGRDRGRDWATLFDAVRGTDLRVKVACRPGDVAGLDVPANVELLGVVDREHYRVLTGRARVVVVPTEVRLYPTGQSVTLESMAMGRCCVVTDTPAMREYVTDGETGLLVPPHDGRALRDALDRAVADEGLRRRLGTAARRAVEERYDATAMWARVAEVISGSASP